MAPMLMAPAQDVVGGLSPPPYSFASSPAASITSTLFDGVGLGVIVGVDEGGREVIETPAEGR